MGFESLIKSKKLKPKCGTILTGKTKPIPVLLGDVYLTYKDDPMSGYILLALEHIRVLEDFIVKLGNVYSNTFKDLKKRAAKSKEYRDCKAMGVMLKHSDWSIARIAKELKVSRTTPYEWKEFMKYFNSIKKFNEEFYRKNMKSGNKDGKTGKIEAWER